MGRPSVSSKGTTTVLNLADYFRANNLKFEGVVFATAEETVRAYESGSM
jgi:general L-amino acid transport system substrate-binding protein